MAWDYLLGLRPVVALLQEVTGIPDDVRSRFDWSFEKVRGQTGKAQRPGTAILVGASIVGERPIRSDKNWVSRELDHFAGNLLSCEVDVPDHLRIMAEFQIKFRGDPVAWKGSKLVGDSAFPVANEPLAEVVDIGTRRHRKSGTSRLSGPEKVVPYSVAELVAIQTGEKGDPWQLSLVQRDAVWKPMQVRYLQDSLLHGYPIGSLLLCSVKVGGHVRVERDGVRIAQEADAKAWQLLDGQQRMNALAELFATKNGSSGGYLLSLTVPSEPGRRGQAQGLS